MLHKGGLPASRLPSEIFVLGATATLLLLPSLLLGNLISHSSPQNLTWAAQFAEQFRAGVLYPRWLPDSFDGLGSPTFYFYSPLAFWLEALLSTATFNTLSVSYCLSFASWILLWASGLAMHAWLKSHAVSARLALYGALAYMAAPYHLVDHYYRGAFAEFAAYAVLPFVALAVRQTANGKKLGPVCLALAYAALPLAHLPTSLLISLTALPLYVLYCGWSLGSTSAWSFFVRCAGAGMLGLGVAAIYLAPALLLQHWIPADTFWAGAYRADNWFLLTPWRWLPPTDMMQIIALCAAGYAIAAIGVLAALRRAPAGWRSEAAFWAAATLLCVLLLSGAIPWLWQVPLLAKVQFPWRLMIVVEFAAITALCLTPWVALSRAIFRVLAAAVVALGSSFAMLGAGVNHRVHVSLAEDDLPADLKQFLPARFPQDPLGGYADLGLEPLKGVPLISCLPRAAVCTASDEPLGDLRIDIASDAPTTVVVRRFLYPFWRIAPATELVPTEPLQLVSFSAPPGRRTYRLQHAPPVEERVAWLISALSLVLLSAWAGIVLRRGPTQGS